eukprot:g33384.t1
MDFRLVSQLPIPLENYTHPAETCLDLLRQYFKTLVTGTLRLSWCPVLYVVAVAHVNNFIFSQEVVDEGNEFVSGVDRLVGNETESFALESQHCLHELNGLLLM